MTLRCRAILCCALLLAGASSALGQQPDGSMTFTVSMDQPSTHYFHVTFRCDAIAGDALDFKMPAWTPGYYQIMDYARNVIRFRAEDGGGHPLAWDKTAKNTWHVRSANSASVTVSYDVFAFTPSVADSYLDDSRAFIAPAGVFMFVAGHLQHTATVVVRPFREWHTVSTGLEPVAARANTFTASDFDVLYDSPILVGNQEVLPFQVRGVRHVLAANGLGTLDRARLVADLSRIVDTAAGIMGEIPYTHYTFMVIGGGGGGLEHLNSTALTMNASGLGTTTAYKNYLAFVAHEYFHNYNVKRIRPVALGPFDYEHENYTKMLWVAEGFTVYYEDLIMNRAGLYSRDEYLDRVRSIIARYENAPGHLFQSATESSFDTWIKYFARNANLANTTISYYDKGAALGLLLDLAIRHETENHRSLDDVMRTLYQQFYKEKKRGYTDEEFRQVCERTAGVPLPEIFDVYAATVQNVDYAKYLAYAGLDIDLAAAPVPGGYLGATTQDQGGSPVVSGVEWDSPAWRAGLSVQDEILAVDGVRVTPRTLTDRITALEPGATVRLLVSRRGAVREIDVVLGQRIERSFRMRPAPNPSPVQSTILASWLKN